MTSAVAATSIQTENVAMEPSLSIFLFFVTFPSYGGPRNKPLSGARLASQGHYVSSPDLHSSRTTLRGLA